MLVEGGYTPLEKSSFRLLVFESAMTSPQTRGLLYSTKES
jgi:hypothetical protein